MISPEKIIVALDFDEEQEVIKLSNELKGIPVWFKVGMELFYSSHKNILLKIHDLGFKIFLDLKLHDIPTTVSKSIKTLNKLPFNMINVHSLGGLEMMKSANDTLKSSHSDRLLIAVTHLTSSSQHMISDELLITQNISSHAIKLAELAKKSGCDGVVASALDATNIKNNCGNDFKIISPGIRPFLADQNDQKRTATPVEAINLGSDFIVIGRPITRALNRKETLEKILRGEMK